ncbi:MAG: hypothetical protein AAF802_32455, partial [Planctomycetota bacterium]
MHRFKLNLRQAALWLLLHPPNSIVEAQLGDPGPNGPLSTNSVSVFDDSATSQPYSGSGHAMAKRQDVTPLSELMADGLDKYPRVDRIFDKRDVQDAAPDDEDLDDLHPDIDIDSDSDSDSEPDTDLGENDQDLDDEEEEDEGLDFDDDIELEKREQPELVDNDEFDTDGLVGGEDVAALEKREDQDLATDDDTDMEDGQDQDFDDDSDDEPEDQEEEDDDEEEADGSVGDHDEHPMVLAKRDPKSEAPPADCPLPPKVTQYCHGPKETRRCRAKMPEEWEIVKCVTRDQVRTCYCRDRRVKTVYCRMRKGKRVCHSKNPKNWTVLTCKKIDRWNTQCEIELQRWCYRRADGKGLVCHLKRPKAWSETGCKTINSVKTCMIER